MTLSSPQRLLNACLVVSGKPIVGLARVNFSLQHSQNLSISSSKTTFCIPLAFHWPHCGFSKPWTNAPLCDAVVWGRSVAPHEGNPLKTELKPKCVISAVSGLRGALRAPTRGAIRGSLSKQLLQPAWAKEGAPQRVGAGILLSSRKGQKTQRRCL